MIVNKQTHLSQHKLQYLQQGFQPHCSAPPGIEYMKDFEISGIKIQS